MKQTLLDKAKLIKDRKMSPGNYSKEHLDLIMAYFNGRITSRQAAGALGKDQATFIHSIGPILRNLYHLGKIEIKIK